MHNGKFKLKLNQNALAATEKNETGFQIV